MKVLWFLVLSREFLSHTIFKSKTSKDGSRATLVISPQPVCVPNEGTVIATNCASSTSLKRHLQRQPAIIRKVLKDECIFYFYF